MGQECHWGIDIPVSSLTGLKLRFVVFALYQCLLLPFDIHTYLLWVRRSSFTLFSFVFLFIEQVLDCKKSVWDGDFLYKMGFSYIGSMLIPALFLLHMYNMQ